MAPLGITRVANLTGLDRIGLPVVAAYRPNARSVAVAQGKGLTLAAARASGLMESIETWHAEHCRPALKYAAAAELAGSHRLADLERLAYAAGAQGSLPPAQPLLWAQGINLLDDTALWLPFELVHANYTLPPPPGSGRFLASTNGLASGNGWLEAVCHAICEVIERDATTLWRCRGGAACLDSPRLDLGTVDDPACRETLAKFDQAGIEVGVWDITSDVGVAAFFCIALERGDRQHHPGFRPANGKGCHPAREIALLRALTEAAQTRLTYISGARDDLAEADYQAESLAASVRDYDALLNQTAPARAFGQIPSFAGADFASDLDQLLRRLRAVGIGQVIAVDLGRPELGADIAVARVVIPGLEGPDEHAAYSPGARARALLRRAAAP